MSQIKTIIVAILCVFVINTVVANPALRDLTGRHIPLSSLQGKWVYINYWASWCQPCLDEIPELNRFYNRFKSKNMIMFGVNYDSLSVAEQKQLVRQAGIKYPSLSHDPSSLLRFGAIRGVPVTFVLNPDGQLIKTLYGPQTVKSLEQVMG